MKNIVSILQDIGFDLYESRALNLALQEHVTAKELSDKGEIPRGKVYSVIKSLRERGLVDETNSRPKEVYVGNPTETLRRIIDEEEQRQQRKLDELRRFGAHLTTQASQDGFFQVGTTVEENEAIQMRVFNEADQEVCQVFNPTHKPSSNRDSKNKYEERIADRVNQDDVVFRAIYPEDTNVPSHLKQLPSSHFSYRRHTTSFPRCDIIDGEQAMIKLCHEDPLLFGGIIFLENKRFAANLHGVFNELWETAKKV